MANTLSTRELYEEIMKTTNKNNISHWRSDLYVKQTKETQKIIDNYQFKHNVKTFTDAISNTPWYDIPFAYMPYWEEVK